MPFIMYHATPAANVYNILKYGLEPRPAKPTTLWTPSENVLYLTNSIDTAKEFADQSYKLRKSDSKAWGILLIEYDEFPDEVYPDLDWGIPGVYYVKRWIPPEHVTYVKRYFVDYLRIRRIRKRP